jgi:carboxypeptidase Ss1
MGVSRAFGGRAEVSFMEGTYPVTVNDPKTTREVAGVLGRIPGTKVRAADQMMWGEDFSRFLEKVPGTFYFLGSGNRAKGCTYPNHSPRFKVDEDALKFGAASLALLASEFTRGSGS